MAKLGSVAWQVEQMTNIGRKLKTGEPLTDADRVFMEIQAEHLALLKNNR